MARGRLWNPEDDARLVALLAEGKAHDAIAAALRRPRSSIGSRLHTLGLRKSSPRPGAQRQRRCLCCSKEFASSGPGNRLCGRCSNKTVSPYAP